MLTWIFLECEIDIMLGPQTKEGICSRKYFSEFSINIFLIFFRMREHKNDIAKSKPLPKVHNHVNNHGHSFNFDDVSVLAFSSHAKIFLNLENIHSDLQSNSMHRSLTFNTIYQSVLHGNNT